MAFKAARSIFRDFVRVQNKFKNYVLQEQENITNVLKCERKSFDSRQNTGRPCYEKSPGRQAFVYHYIKKISKLLLPGNRHFYPFEKSWLTRLNRSPVLFGAFGLAYYGSPDALHSSKLSINDVLLCLNMICEHSEKPQNQRSIITNTCQKPDALKDFILKERLGEPSSSAAVYAAEYQNKEYAVKVMFNYEYASNEYAIKKGFSRECCILNKKESNSKLFETSSGYHLPEHPNIIKALDGFIEETPCLHDALESYPSALPRRVNSNGLGRNKTLCLVMPKYDCTLRTYLIDSKPADQDKLLLFAQLLEGVAHLVENHEAHRDLKTDNILLEKNETGGPRLVITDFGCCLGDQSLSMMLPFESDHVDRGGNSALMAPEIASAVPTNGGFLDYSKADVWACGAIGLDIFGLCNPFVCGWLESRTYQDEDISEFCGNDWMICKMINALLRRDPSQRPNANEAALFPILILYAPENWMKCSIDVTERDVNTWLMSMWLRQFRGERHCSLQEANLPTELTVRKCFLKRATTATVLSALTFLKVSMSE